MPDAELYHAAQRATAGTNIPPQILYGIAVQEGALVPGTLAHDQHNVGGIKGGGPNSISVPTREFINGQWVTETASFRVFDSVDAGMRGIVNFLQTNSRYRTALNQSTPDAFALSLQQAGYATDPDWSHKIIQIGREAFVLFGGDKPGEAPPEPDEVLPGGINVDPSIDITGPGGAHFQIPNPIAGIADALSGQAPNILFGSVGIVLILVGLVGLALASLASPAGQAATTAAVAGATGGIGGAARAVGKRTVAGRTAAQARKAATPRKPPKAQNTTLETP